MAGFTNMKQYAQTSGTEGVATNATFAGPWVSIIDRQSLGWQVVLTGTGSPTAAFKIEVTDDDDAPAKADANLSPGFSDVTPAALTSVNPAGGGGNVNIQVTMDPGPRARFARFRYVFTSGGSANQLLKVGHSSWGAGS